MSEENNIMISVITVSYNAITSIEKTIQSVINQTYPNIEYIIIDGKSNDGTTDIIKKYSDKISYWCSEPDKGIYDAMNKAIDIANGEWILFLNAGDTFVDNNVLFQLFAGSNNLSNYSVLYGDTILKYPWGNIYNKGNFFSKNDMFLPFCHQSAFVKTALMKEYKFDLSYKIVADYNFFYNLYRNGERFLHIEKTISIYDMEGFSSQRVIEAYIEVAKINGTYKSYRYYKNTLYLRFRQMVLEFLPIKLVEIVRQLRRTLN